VVELNQSVSGPEERETIAGVAFPLAISGRRSLLLDAATIRGEQAGALAHELLFESALAFRESYVAAAIALARVQVLSEQQRTLDGLSAVIRAMSKSGEAAGYDVLRHRVQAQRHRHLVESASAEAQALLLRLESWTGASVSLQPGRLADLAGGPGLRSRIDATAVAQHPRLRGLAAEARALEVEARAASRRWVPEPEIFAGYRGTTVESTTGHGVALALNLPLTFFDHGQAELARSEAERDIARATRERMLRSQQGELKAARARLAVLEASASELEQMSADAGALEVQAKQLYAAGEASLSELLDALRAAEDARLSAIDVADSIARARLSLMRTGGTFFEPSLDRACGVRARSSR
jgi:cobalt-zinc-cadmium efflux system outer membrane protein